MFTIDMFNVNYTITGTNSYRIEITPKGYIFLSNVTLICKTMDAPTPLHKAINQRPFKPTNYAI